MQEWPIYEITDAGRSRLSSPTPRRGDEMRIDTKTYKTDRGGKVQVIGPRQPHPEHGIYLRIEDAEGRYIGSIDGAALRRLAAWLAEAVPAPTPRRLGTR